MFNGGLNFAQSYYLRTAHPAPRRPALRGAVEADLLVIGGGCTGLAAALTAAAAGRRVVLLEGGRLGWGASGRNGGQIIPGLRWGPGALMRRYGADLGGRLFTLAVSARDLVLGLIAEHGIACDLAATGHLHVTDRAADLAELEREADLAAQLGYPHLRRLDRGDLAGELDSDAYVGGLLDRQGGHFHPLNYALGLAAAAERAGAVLHEESAVLEIGPGVSARTAAGSVTARHGILACDALLGRLDRRLAGRIMPIASHMVATAPLPAPVIRRNRAVSDSRFSVNYFRHSADGRLLFGGGERIRPGQAADIDALVRPPLERIFPQLRGIAFEHLWGGLVSITRTRLPDLGRRGDWLHAQGYSGQGAILSSLAGRLLAAAAAGGDEEFERFRRLQPPPFPGGDLLRTPLHVLGMLTFGLLDRLR